MSKTNPIFSQTEAAKSGVTITSLISYRLQLVGNLMSRVAALHYRNNFDVSLWEWRTIALLGARPGLSLNQLAKVVDLDKGLASRVITALADRGLVQRRTDEHDARAIRLNLTKEGERLYTRLIKAAAFRNETYRNALTRQEWDVLDQALTKLERLGREMLAKEKQSAESIHPPPSRKST